MARTKLTWRKPVKTNDKFVKPPIPLEKAKRKERRAKDQKVEYTLKINPADDNSESYKEYVYKFSDGKPEELLLLLTQVNKVFKGLKVTTGPNQFAIMRTILQDEALTAFDKANAGNTETLVSFKNSVEALKRHVFPKNPVYKQMTAMRSFKKPYNMKVKTFINRLNELNNYLTQFPDTGDDFKFKPETMRLIVETAIPSEWRKKLYKNGFYPHKETMAALQLKLEAYEDVESGDFEDEPIPRKAKLPTENPKKRKEVTKSSTGFYCEIHGQNNTHDTANCYNIKKMKKDIASKKATAKKPKALDQSKLEANIMSYVQKALQSNLKKAKEHNVMKATAKEPAADSSDEEALPQEAFPESQPEIVEIPEEDTTGESTFFNPFDSDESDSDESGEEND